MVILDTLLDLTVTNFGIKKYKSSFTFFSSVAGPVIGNHELML